MSSLDRFKVCPACGEENLPNAADCVRCGTDILMERVEHRRQPARVSEAEPLLPVDSPASVPAGSHIRLESLADPSRVFYVTEGQTVGRAEQSDVIIEGVPDVDSVSRRMALFGRHGRTWFVQHIAKTNYIAVDGEEYESDDEVTVRDGTVLGLALCQFIVRVPEESP